METKINTLYTTLQKNCNLSTMATLETEEDGHCGEVGV